MDRIPMLSFGQPTVRDQSPSTLLQTASSRAAANKPSSCPQGQCQMKQGKEGNVRLTSPQGRTSRQYSRGSRQVRQINNKRKKREKNQLAPTKQQRRSKMIKRTDEESKKQLPWCLRSSKRNTAPAMETEDIQATPTETPDDIQIFDSEGRVLQPGDGVAIGPVFSQVYDGIYVGNMQVVRCEEDTQKVIIEKLDVSRKFIRLAPYSEGRCEILPAQMRADRARSCIGRVSPVSETRWGLNFVIWACTGLNHRQAMIEGFRLW